MTRIGKLYARALQGDGLRFAEFCRLMEAFGYRHSRTSGSHFVFVHVGIADSRIVQPRGKDAKLYQIRQFLDIIETRGLALDD